ncbi:MAG: pantetheine-phosphate adenylyltransferase [Clostridiales bacterium]|nr:pantetheine-phosphate adenylyltransferase [Clostridiales bacterium]
MIASKILYAGTFDPVTNGHLDVIRRAAKLCDTLVVGVLTNSDKRPKYSVDERIRMLRLATEGLNNTEFVSYDGLLADFVNNNGIGAVVRGLRAAMDFEYEIRIAQMNAKLFKDGAETIFLMTDPANSFINSSIVKEVFALGGSIEGLVPPKVYEFMKKLEKS